MSAPGGNRLDEALADLEFMVSIDQYVNETNRHADVILPPVSAARAGRGGRGAALGRDPQPHSLQPRGGAQARGRQGGLGDPERHYARLGRGIATKARVVRRLGARLASPARVVESAIAAGPYGILRRGPIKGLTLGQGQARQARSRPGADEAAAARRAPLRPTSVSRWRPPRSCSRSASWRAIADRTRARAEPTASTSR